MTHCSAIVNALNAKGWTSEQLATQINSSAGRVNDILSGKTKPTQAEFNSIASQLGLSNNPVHASSVVGA